MINRPASRGASLHPSTSLKHFSFENIPAFLYPKMKGVRSLWFSPARRSHTDFEYPLCLEVPYMEVLNFVLSYIRQYQSLDRKALPYRGSDKDSLAEPYMPCRGYRFESQKQNSSHQRKRSFRSQELPYSTPSHCASGPAVYSCISWSFRSVLCMSCFSYGTLYCSERNPHSPIDISE